MSETTRVRRKDVEEALAMLSRAAIDLGMRNRYEIEFGSKSSGVHHLLVDYPPNFDRTQATTHKIGKDFRTALYTVCGMAYGLQSAKRERDRQEEVLSARRVSRDVHLPRGAFTDPDARSVRRATEERIPDRPDGWHPERPV